MNRKIKNDADKLINYFKEYTLEDIFTNEGFKNKYRMVHKKALGYLVLFAEIEIQNKKKNTFSEKSMFYLKESVSDVLQSFFTWVNGAYKGADLLLRSSIENFNKAIIGNYNNQVYVEKSVYKIFDMASQRSEYQSMMTNESFYDVLHRVYVELCKSTHTATNDDMDHITAMNLLPKYDDDKAEDYMNLMILLLDAYLGFFLANYKEFVDKMYRENMDIFYDVLSKNIIRNIVNK